MLKYCLKTAGLLILALSLLVPSIARADYGYIDLTNPFLKKMPIAVPVFKTLSAASEDGQIARDSADILTETLGFTGYFEMLDRGAFLFDPQSSAIVNPGINFRNWTVIGAELLITGALTVKDNLMVMELRLYDTIKEQLLVGRRYNGVKDDQRLMIRRFCSEVIYRLTGNRGIFNSKIAFISTGSGNKELYICDFDGFKPRQLTQTKNITMSPSWSSDASYIAYTSYYRGKPDIYIRSLADNRESVIANKGINITPAWAPGKFELAATLSFSGDPEIYLLTGTGKIIKRLTNKWGIDVSPTWSPDGKKMAFVSNRSGSPQIYIKDLTSGRDQRLTFEGSYNTTPSWSPKGDKIAYSGMNGGHFNIYTISLDGSNIMRLTHEEGDNESPSWSPDGNLVAFSSTREGKSQIFVMTAYGTEQRRLLDLQGEQTNPKWSPGVFN